jgi:hypothetical protein
MGKEIIYYSYRNSQSQAHGFLHGLEPTSANKDFIASLDDAERVRFLRCPAYKEL